MATSTLEEFFTAAERRKFQRGLEEDLRVTQMVLDSFKPKSPRELYRQNYDRAFGKTAIRSKKGRG